MDERDEILDAFNARFFDGDPADYLRTRLQLLLLVAARPEAVEQIFAEGLTFESINVAERGTPPADVEAIDTEALDRFVTLETIVLLHHAAETVLRFYVAQFNEVPWLDIASRTNFGKFKDLVRETFVETPPVPEELGFAFRGYNTRPDDQDPAEWDAIIEGCGTFMRTFAVTFLDDAPMYNAIKHGLAATPGSTEMFFGGVQLGTGPALNYPAAEPWADDTRKWSLVTRWVDRGEALALINIATAMLDTMWRIAHARSLPPASRPDLIGDLFTPITLRPSSLRSENVSPTRVMKHQLLLESRSED